MKKLLLASTGLNVAVAFMSDTCEVVVVNGVRVNKADYEADQEKPAAERQYSAKAKPEEPADAARGTMDGPPLAAPSAPHFASAADSAVAPTPIDPLKGAAAPVNASPNQRLVLKEKVKGGGERYFVVDGNGQKITDLEPAIDPKGYDTEELAQAAIRALPH